MGDVSLDTNGYFSGLEEGRVSETDVLVASLTPGLETLIVPFTEEPNFKRAQSEAARRCVVRPIRFIGAKDIWDAVDVVFEKDLKAARKAAAARTEAGDSGHMHDTNSRLGGAG